METGLGEAGCDIRPATGAKECSPIAALPTEEVGQQHNPVVVAPALARFAVANLESHPDRSTRRDLEPVGLDPEVMRESGRGNDGKRQKRGAEKHENQSFESRAVRRHMLRVPRRIERLVAFRINIHAAFATLALALLTLSPSPAAAHGGTGLVSGFASGFVHPLSGLDHALAMVAVGLWGAILGRPLLIALPTIFPVVIAVGGAIGMANVPVPPLELGIAISVITLGMMVLLSVRAPLFIACAIVAVFALFHGYAHGQELPSAADPVGYSAGFVLSTGLLHVLGIAIGALKTYLVGTWALRAAGGAIAISGLWFLNQALLA